MAQEGKVKLLTTNAKLKKGSYNIVGLSLVPANLSGRNVCPEHTKSCKNICVGYYSGRTVMPNVREAMTRRTNFFFEDRKGFLRQLHKELAVHSKKENALCRLNISSDLDFAAIDPTLFTNYPEIIHYGYTKVSSRIDKFLEGKYPTNLHLTYSLNENSDKRKVNRWLKKGVNVAAVFNIRYHPQSGNIDPMIKQYQLGTKSWPVVDGDMNDARIPSVDGKGVIVGLRAKGSRANREKFTKTGFILEV